jgi:peptide/nickel transport system substrate-binding protein
MIQPDALQSLLINLTRVVGGWRRSMSMAVAVASLFLLAACGAPAAAPADTAADSAAGEAEEAAAGEPQTGGRLVFAAETIGESLEPGLWNGFGISNVLDNVGAYLTRPNSSGVWTDPPEGGLAESWEISDDGLVYTFNVRPDVVFHDGTPVDANAIVRSLTRQVNPEDSSYVEGLYMHTNYTLNRASIEAVDDMTVRIELETPDAAYLYRLFHPSAVIISSAALDEFGADINTNMVSAGPFKLERFIPGSEAVLTAFEDYWDGRPYLDEIVLRGYPDEGAMLAAIESGEVNFAPYPPSSAIPRLSETDGIKVVAGPPLINFFLGNNMMNAPLDNREIRFAINYAINRENLIEAVLYGLGEMPASFVGPTEFGFDPAGYEISTQDGRADQERSGSSRIRSHP